MIPFEAARALVIQQAQPLPVVIVAMQDAAGRFLAEVIRAPFDMPRFDSAAVDGYCVRVKDVEKASNRAPVTLRWLRTVRAGEEAGPALKTGEAVKIMTGAPVPAGTEAVVMREFCEETEGTVAVECTVQAGQSIRRAGAEYRQGDAVLSAGVRLSPPVIGELAGTGLTRVRVRALPRVAILTTGDELIPPGEELRAAGIYDGNSMALAAACHALGIRECRVSHSPDELETLVGLLREAVSEADVVVTVGGASVGDYDFVKDALGSLGAQVHFTRVAMKPGKPNVFATVPSREREGRSTLIFGLPGNPVSALVSFHHFVRPALLLLMGAQDVSPLLLSARLATTLHKRAGRMEFVRASLAYHEGQLTVRPTRGQESHMIGGLCGASCLIHFPADAVTLEKDSLVTVEMLTW